MTTPALDQTYGPSSMQVWYDDAVTSFRSPISGKQQRLHQYGLWRMTLGWESLDLAAAMPILAFFEARGLTERFTVYDQARPLPQGVARHVGGPPTAPVAKVKTASQRGKSLVTYNWQQTSGTLFKAGDLIGMAATGEVYTVAANVAAPASPSNNVTIPLAQFIRTSPATDELVVCEKVPFTMVNEQVVKPRIAGPTIYTFDVQLVEDFG